MIAMIGIGVSIDKKYRCVYTLWMNWKTIIADLRERGHTQSSIAKRCGVSQATICDLANGKILNPSWQLGDALVRMLSDGESAERAVAS
ncbi:MAG TPA: helix-turn-helix transcriptional regulator [Denitromonas sp.]|nr:helix-turn-helix transcriptional regulator [Denitromonas sp.]HQV16288.1 helix-turn-helix transcriptional regulator [Denitromonas sp.]